MQFRNALLVEQPNGDFAVTMVRQFLFDAHSVLLWDALDMRFRTVRLKRDPACALCGEAAAIRDLSAHGAVSAPACAV